jgi:hypothetical protein
MRSVACRPARWFVRPSSCRRRISSEPRRRWSSSSPGSAAKRALELGDEVGAVGQAVARSSRAWRRRPSICAAWLSKSVRRLRTAAFMPPARRESSGVAGCSTSVKRPSRNASACSTTRSRPRRQRRTPEAATRGQQAGERHPQPRARHRVPQRVIGPAGWLSTCSTPTRRQPSFTTAEPGPDDNGSVSTSHAGALPVAGGAPALEARGRPAPPA